jgi:tetratricopeptide (TPR) repeat protein
MADSPRVEELRRRVRSDPASIAFAALAEELRRAQQFAEAVEVARAGLRRHPAYASARVTLGRALFELGDIEPSRLELEQALASAPENLAALRSLADLYRHTGADARARELARRGAALAPQDRELRALLQALGPESQAHAPEPEVPPVESPPQSAPQSAPGEPGAGSQPPTAPEPAPLAVSSPPGPVGESSPALQHLQGWLDAIVRERLRREANAGLPE